MQAQVDYTDDLTFIIGDGSQFGDNARHRFSYAGYFLDAFRIIVVLQSRRIRPDCFPDNNVNAYFENVTELITDLLNHRLRLPYPLHIAIRRTPPRLKAILYRLMPIDYLPVSVREDIQIFDFSKEVGFETIDVYILIDQQTAMVTIEFSCRIHIPKGRVPLADWICARQTECLPCGTALFDRTIPDRYLIKNSIPFQNCFCGDTFSETYHSLELSLKKCIPEIRELRRKKLPEKYQTMQKPSLSTPI